MGTLDFIRPSILALAGVNGVRSLVCTSEFRSLHRLRGPQAPGHFIVLHQSLACKGREPRWA